MPQLLPCQHTKGCLSTQLFSFLWWSLSRQLLSHSCRDFASSRDRQHAGHQPVSSLSFKTCMMPLQRMYEENKLRCVQKRRLWSFFLSVVPTCSTSVVISLVALVAFLNKVIWGTLKQTHSSPPSSYKPLSVMQPRRERLPTASRKRLGGSLRKSRTSKSGTTLRVWRSYVHCSVSLPSSQLLPGLRTIFSNCSRLGWCQNQYHYNNFTDSDSISDHFSW